MRGVAFRRPVPPDTPVALSSPRRTLEGISRAAVSDLAWGSRTAMNLPALATTPRAMPTQRGMSVVTETEAESIASLMCMVPSLTPAFIAARTASGWVLSS
jgi:hypothetical protein